MGPRRCHTALEGDAFCPSNECTMRHGVQSTKDFVKMLEVYIHSKISTIMTKGKKQVLQN